MEAFFAAVENGADAVYLGARAFSARGYASNFSEKELEEAIDYAHLRGVKVYVTVNTLLKEEEVENALKLLSWLREIGTDAIIIQDLGLISLARKYLPDLPLHGPRQKISLDIPDRGRPTPFQVGIFFVPGQKMIFRGTCL